MSKPWLRHRDITLSELQLSLSAPEWIATMDGRATPTRETVVMSRRAKSAGEAIVLLKEALEEQGYEVRAER